MNPHEAHNERLEYIESNREATSANIRNMVLDLNKRHDNLLWQDKLDEIRKGKEAIRNEYGDVYTPHALQSAVDDYAIEANDKAVAELRAYDEETARLADRLSAAVAEKEVEIEKLSEPQTSYELEQHRFHVDKIRFKLDNLFASGSIRTDKLDPLFQRAEYDKPFAKALIQARDIPYSAVQNSEMLTDPEKNTLIANLDSKYEALASKTMPKGYNFIKVARIEADALQRQKHGQLDTYNLLSRDTNIQKSKLS